MSLEIKLSPSWYIVNNEHSSSGVVLEHRAKSKSSSKVRIDRTYHGGLAYALKYYAKVAIANNDKKVKSVREYLDEFDTILKEATENVKEAQQYFETDVTPKENSSKKQ